MTHLVSFAYSSDAYNGYKTRGESSSPFSQENAHIYEHFCIIQEILRLQKCIPQSCQASGAPSEELSTRKDV